MYDYYKAVKEDIEEWIEESVIDFNRFDDKDKAYEYLFDVLWTRDDITGNGGYGYLNEKYCRAYVLDNISLALEACEEFWVEYSTLKAWQDENKFFINLDSNIRCYVLSQVLDNIIIERMPE